jgi:peptidylprolyl isomerase domain and WD repeat-containing protein 1
MAKKFKTEEKEEAVKAVAEDDSSDDDFGPMPASAPAAEEETVEDLKRKRTRKLEFENVYIDGLPSKDSYECSYMHRDIVTHVVVSKATDYLMTASLDGHVKFWKKMLDSVEFVKHYQAHIGRIYSFVVSPDQKLLVTTGSDDKMIKFFEISGFDMCNMISVPYSPTSAVWLTGGTGGNLYCDRVAVADMNSGLIRIYKTSGAQEPLKSLDLHFSPVRCMCLNTVKNCVISLDSRGVVEYWNTQTLELPSSLPLGGSAPVVKFSLKTDTDLYDLAKHRATPYSVACSPKGDQFAVYSSDKHIRIFNFEKGKLIRKYDESIPAYVKVGEAKGGHTDTMESSRRQAMERELESLADSQSLQNLVFDDSGHFLVFGSISGIKILNTVTNKLARVLGAGESGERFLAVALYQGVPKVDAQLLLARAGDTGMTKTAEEMSVPKPDPTVFATSFKKRRFYCFSNRLANEAMESRDKLNEQPTEEEREGQNNEDQSKDPACTTAVLHTTLGSITIKLYAQECPNTIENFTTHIRNHYYDSTIFHRVIKGFMVQCGDPLGDGTGGDSIWGREFEDEFNRNLRHDRPFTVSMANSGPNTNGSQFFITTAPAPWLDNKHTVFGRVTGGFDVVSKIEELRANKLDKPYDEAKILSSECH